MGDKRTILVDGDTIAFIAASASQNILENENGVMEYFTRRAEAETIVDNSIQYLKDALKATDVEVFLSCPSAQNWRLTVDTEYKSNRKNSVRPIALDAMKQYLRLKHGARHYAHLEADDALGIFATHPTLIEGEKVIVGRDKDFKTIPGLHYQLKDLDSSGNPVVREVTTMEAQLNHYVQALAGDAVDGYAGCPGIGMKRAREIVEDPHKLVPVKGVITRGKNKGKEVTKWNTGDPCSVWEAVVCQYEKAGLGEEEAIRTARLARILHSHEYDLETRQVTLWVPGKE